MVDVQPQTAILSDNISSGDISPQDITNIRPREDRSTNKGRSPPPPSSSGPAEKRIRLETIEINSDEESEPREPVPSLAATFKNYSDFRHGPFVPIIRDDDRLVLDSRGILDSFTINKNVKSIAPEYLCVLPDDSIVEAPSLVTPLLLKKKTIWPRLEGEKKPEAVPEQTKEIADSDDIQVLKVVDKCQIDGQPNGGLPPTEPICKTKDVEEYIKSATIASLTNNKSGNTKSSVLTIDDYYSSSAGKLLLGLGLSRVNQFILEQDVSRTTRKIRRATSDCPEMIEKLESLRERLSQARASNSVYHLEHKLKCPCCSFKSDLMIVLDEHLEKPHRVSSKKYTCNWCDFRAYDSNQVVIHSLVEHKKRSKSEKPPVLHSCIFCPFETNSKGKLATHQNRCEQTFPHDSFLGPADYKDEEYPGVTSKFITQSDIRCYDQTLKSLRLAAYNPYHLKAPFGQSHSAYRSLLVVPRNNNGTQDGEDGSINGLRQESTPLLQVGNISSNEMPPNVALNPLRTNAVLLGSSHSASKNTLQGK